MGFYGVNQMTPNTYHKAVPPSQNRYVWLFVLAAIVLVGIFFGTRIYVDYNRTIHTAEERLLTQTRVIDENIATNLTVVNLMLNDIVTKLKDTSGGSQLNDYLKQQLVMTPGIRTLIITNSQGRCIYSNRDELLGTDFPKDRDYFKVPRDAPDKGMLFLSPPYTTILGKYVINITKPLIGKHHEFNGIVSVTFDPDYFSALLTSTIYAPDNRVSLVHGDDGTVFIAVPEAKIPVTGVKVTQPGSAFLQHISGGTPTSVRIAAGKTLGDKRIFAYRTNIPKGVRFDKQIIVAASRNQHEVLAVWLVDAGIDLVVFLLFASLSIVITRVMLQRGIELKRLEETRAHLAAIVEFSDDAIISKDTNGVILSWNAGAERLFAYTPDEAVGRSITMLIPPELQDEENRILQSLKAGELVEHLETVRIAKDGRLVDVSVTSSPLKDTIGQVIGASKIIRDITERKLAERKLQESQGHLQAASEELEAQNEELQSQSEELQAQAEELQEQSEELQNQNQELKELWEKSRQAEASLLESRHDLDRAQEVGSIGSWRLDVRINVLTWSDENHRIFGIPKGTPLTYETFLSTIHPDDRHYVNTQWNAGLRGEPYDIEHRLLVNDQVKWVREKAYLEFEEDGTLIGGFGITQDITERKQAEEALRKIQAELELRIKERTHDLAKAVKVLEEEIHERRKAELNLQRLNRLYAVLSETNHTIVKIIDRDSLFRDFCRIAVEHGGFVLSWIGLVDGQSGQVRIVASSGATAYLNDIRITANKEPEGEGPTGIVLREGTYYICNDFQNDPCTRPWHDQGKKYGLRASASIAIKENDRVIGALTLYGGEKDYFDVQHVELLLQMGMDISFALDNLNRENSRKAAEKALYEETSERLKAVETLREKEQMLIQQSRQAAMGEMIGNIAHQWRQPLNTLGLYTQRLGAFYGMPTFNKEFLDNTIAKTMEIIKHMSKTIDDFRDYFKPERGKADFYVNEAIKSTLSLLEGNFNNPKIAIALVEHDTPIINGYQNEFAQVFLNILNNARDAIIEREINDARVTITIRSEGSCAVVTVADNAGGIPDEVINKVFDPYFTTKGPQLGTGIGLFMSKTIIEKNMGGRLTVRNTDTGAEFRIEVERGSQN